MEVDEISFELPYESHRYLDVMESSLLVPEEVRQGKAGFEEVKHINSTASDTRTTRLVVYWT